jgi:hypothetical protein
MPSQRNALDLASDLLDLDQPDVRLIDECGSLERMAGAFAAHMAPREAAQFPMDEGQQPVQCSHLTPRPGPK